MSIFLTAALLGIGVGALYAMASYGVISIYRGSGVLNFAQGAIGLMAAYVWYELNSNAGWPYWLAIVAAVAFAAVVGALIHLLLMRPLSNASSLSRTVATLAVLIIIQSVLVLIYGLTPTIVRSAFPPGRLEFFGVGVSIDRLFLVCIAAVIAVGLWAIYRFSPFGLSTSAVAENRRGAASLGVSPDRVATINWALGSALAAVAAILVAPIVTLQITTMTTLVLAALAAALVAQLRSFGIAFAASIAMGVAQGLLAQYVPQAWVSQVVPFVLIVLVMVFRGQAIPLRDFLLEKLPSVGTGRIRPTWVLIGAVLVAIVIGLVSGSWAAAISMTLSAAIVMISVIIISGYTGQLSLAQFALAGFGAFVQGRLAAVFDMPAWLSVICGILGAAALGAIFALPAIRTRGINLAIVTLGLGSALEIALFNNSELTGGFVGTPVKLDFFGLDIRASTFPERYAWVALLAFVIVALLLANVRRGRIGRRMLAVRTNERAAASLGIDARKVKLHSFALAAGIAAVGGILIANRGDVIDFTTFTSFQSILYVGFTFLGGIGYVLGSVLGAFFIPGSVGTQIGDLIFSGIAAYAELIGGVLLIVTVLINRDGVASELLKQGKAIIKRLFQNRKRKPKPAQQRSLPNDFMTTVAPKTLEVRALTVRYGAVTAVEDVTLTVSPGKIVGLIGPNGAGKTSLVDAVTGFTRMSSGSIMLDGMEISQSHAYQRSKAGISRSFQSLELFEDLTVYENLQTASDRWTLATYLTDAVYPAKSLLPDEVLAVVDLFDLQDELTRKVSDLPYGVRRLVAIARAIASQPSVVLLDEPGAGLSQSESAHLATLVRKLADEWGMSVLVIEHDTDFVMSICDEIVVLDFGRTICVGPPAAVRNDPAVIKAYLGGPINEGGDPDGQPAIKELKPA